nr:PREDICTED: gustatory and pheromone receptor 39a, isoform D-like [Tribolium castaneum]|eukprot:XP_015836411.1 PREDICTED: gustatory and pheromone receptor 39a, isoform D-like [Tribolium castaneum]
MIQIAAKVKYAKYVHIKLVMRILRHILKYCLCSYAIIGASFFNSKPWCKLLSKLQDVEESRFFYVEFLITNAVFWLVSLFSTYSYFGFSLFKRFEIVVTSLVQSYVMFYYNYLIYAILKIIRAKYKDLNKALKKGVISSKQIETSLFNLKEIVDTFNKIFGWPLLFIIFTSSIIFLDYTDEFFNGKIFALEGRKFGMALGSYVSMALLTSYGAIVVILLCDYIGEEMTKVEERLFKLKRASSEKEISSILVNVRYTFPKFSAAGFFVIGKSTILTVLGTVVTFLVIMVQFKENK